MNIEQFKTKYSLEYYYNGGGFTCLFFELNTCGNYLLISDEEGDFPQSDAALDDIVISVYDSTDTVICSYVSNDIDYLCTIMESILTLWGNA